MRNIPTWPEYFFLIAQSYALRSKDPTCQVGAVIVEPRTRTIKSGGYNGMVRGVRETDKMWTKPTKRYDLICHAEFNAVAIAARHGISIEGCEMYVTCHPCIECAKLVVQSGITRVLVMPGSRIASSASKDFESVVNLFQECHVNFHFGPLIT